MILYRMKVISIGMQCTLNRSLRFVNKRNIAYPFDWILSTPKVIYELLELLLVKNMDIKELVMEHFFKCDKKCNMNFPEHHYIDDINGKALINTNNNLIFPHDDDSNETIEKYIRRFTRLKNDILNNDEDICFVYTSQSSSHDGNFTINGVIQLTEVYMYLNKIYELIGEYRENYKFIVFDAIKNEDKSILNKDIVVYELHSCGDWLGIQQQLILSYMWLF